MDSIALAHYRASAIEARKKGDAIRLCLRRSCHAALHYKDEDCNLVTYEAYNGSVSHTCTGKRGACGCPHAEAKVIVQALLNSVNVRVLVTTMSPCVACAWLIRLSGIIDTVLYLEDYDVEDGVSILRHAGIEVIKL